ncbi:MAG: ABC transporter substrate-binding protein [Pseudomonadota bacterium]
MNRMQRIGALLGFGLLAITAATAWAQSPDEIVRTTTAELFAAVDADRTHLEQNPDQLIDLTYQILVPRIDTVYSGRLVLGRSGRGLEQEQIERFADNMSDMLIRQYADALLEFQTRDQIEVLPMGGDNSDRMTKVRTRVRLSTGARTPVDYVFRNTDQGWKIFDVIVEGISYVTTFRNQIGEEIRQHGFEGMIERLESGQVEVDVDE